MNRISKERFKGKLLTLKFYFLDHYFDDLNKFASTSSQNSS